jgi:hypothetical protein
MRLLRLDSAAGKILSETVLDDRDPETGDNLQVQVRGLNMPVALPDVLSSDGSSVFMRSQRFDLKGIRQESTPEKRHLFCPTGFLDDTWLHRSYWLYGNSFTSGAGGYSRAGRQNPAGRLLVFDDTRVYGYGRKPDYFRWVTPMDYRLFSARLDAEVVNRPRDGNAQPLPRRGGFFGRRSRGGPAGLTALPNTQFTCEWTQETSLYVGAMVKAGQMLFIAGPQDIVDEDDTIKRIGEAAVQTQLAEQSAIWKGERGAVLQAVSAADGTKLAEYELESPPRWDGMAVANGRLYFSTQDGNVLCMESQ